MSNSIDRCALLEVLPPEVRLRIYEELFDEAYHSSLLIRSDSKIELISLAKAHAALLKTCWTIYREAVPILYDATTFRVQIYPVEGYSSHGNINRLHASTPFLRRMQHVEIKSCIVLPCHIEPALRLMKTFACALEDSDARIKTLHVRSKLFNDMSKRKLYEYREKLGRRGEAGTADGRCQLFQQMIEGASNSTGFVSISLDAWPWLAWRRVAPSFNVTTSLHGNGKSRSFGQDPLLPFLPEPNTTNFHGMPTSVDKGLVKFQTGVARKKPELLVNDRQEIEQHSAREVQERLSARLFQRDVEAAAVATRNASAVLLPHQQQPPTASNTEQPNTMAGNLSLDSLVMKILGKIHPPAAPTKELRDLVGLLPAAVHAERAAHEAKVNELTQKINQSKSKKEVDPATAKEINNLKSVEGGLKADMKKLETAFKDAGSKNVHAQARKELESLRSRTDLHKADILRFEQNVKDGKTQVTLPYVSNRLTKQTVASTSANSEWSPTVFHSKFTQLISDNMREPREPLPAHTPYPKIVTNPTTRPQLSARSPPQDPRPQLYMPTPTGFYFEPPGATSAPRVFQGNEKQTIHPSRLGQMDEASVSKVQDSALPGRIAAALGTSSAILAQIDSAHRQRQAGGQLTADRSSIQPIYPPTTEASATSDTSKYGAPRFFESALSYASQRVPSTEIRDAQGPSTRDPRLAGRPIAPTDKKRAASPSIEHEVAKKVKVESPEKRGVCTPQDTSAQSSKPNGELMRKECDRTCAACISEDEIEELEAQYVEAKRRHATPRADTGDMTVDKPTSQAVPEQPGPAVDGQSPTQQERRDSAATAPAAPVASPSLSNRQPICARCRFARLACDHKIPCEDCSAHKVDCVYWSCEYGADCTSATCWFSHEPAAEALSEPEQLLDSTAVGAATAAS